MSIDWDRRQGTLGRHKHLAADILDETSGAGAITPTIQTISLLDPVTVAFDDEGVEDTPGIKITDLDAGQLVIKTWVVSTEAWGGTTAPILIFSIGDSDGSPRLDMEAWELGVETASGGGVTLRRSGAPSESGFPQSMVLRDDGGVTALYVRYAYDSGTPDSGSAKCYVLIATPT